MTFITDKQTLADLNLLGKYKAGSMFNLFNRVRTRGGELLLEELFRNPLTSAEAINERTACLRHLQGLDINLDIDGEMVEMAAQYLTGNGPGSRLSSVISCYKEKVQEMLYRSPALVLHQQQIRAVQLVLQAAGDLLRQLREKGKPDNACQPMQDQLEAIVEASDLKRLQPRERYTIRQTAECQYLFLNKGKRALEDLLQLIYKFDVYLSVADVGFSKGMNFARAHEGDQRELMEVVNLRHPSLHEAIGNALSLTRKQNVLFLTGANMAGKSTWMKTLGISYYLAHMGFPVAADSMSFRVMEGIFTSINVPDDISLGWSHFYAEVMRVKLVAKEVSSGKKLFVLFDELFKGTNVKDAYDATLAVTQKLARYRSCAFVISTHIIEVGEDLRDTANIQFGYMPTVMKGTVPQYTYQLTPGITRDRQGMIIIENEKILEMLAVT